MEWIFPIAIICFGLWAGITVARKSAANEAVAPGPARVFHYVAASIATVIPLTLLTATFIFRTSFAQSASICLGMFAFEFVMLFLYAAFQGQTSNATTTPAIK